MFIIFLLYCYYYSVMYVSVMPVSAYTALAFVFGFIQINWWWWWWWWKCCARSAQLLRLCFL